MRSFLTSLMLLSAACASDLRAQTFPAGQDPSVTATQGLQAEQLARIAADNANSAALASVIQSLTQLQLSSLTAPGSPFTLATLPTCPGSIAGKIGYVTDLGGGADNLICKGTGWGRVRPGTPVTSSTCSSLNIPALSFSNVIQLTCSSGFSTGSVVNFVGANPGDDFWIQSPSSLSTLLGGLGVQMNGITVAGLKIGASTTYHYQVKSDGTLFQLQP